MGSLSGRWSMVERRLGRGLDFFLSGSGKDGKEGSSESRVEQLEISSLVPSPHQPRHSVSDDDLEKLSRSVRASGIIQPILVRKVGKRYEIIAGERRWRAAKMVGLERVPALVRPVTDEQSAVWGLVENLQRADLNALEKALAFKRLQDLMGGTQEDLARQVGLDRSTVANFIRLLDLPQEVQDLVSRGTLTMGHARALLALLDEEEQKKVATEVVKKKLSVRDLEDLVKTLNAATEVGTKKAPLKGKRGRPIWLNEIEENLVEALGTAVRVQYGKKRSRITIECIGRPEFERVYELLRGGEAEDEKGPA